jgi:hypothetical protein
MTLEEILKGPRRAIFNVVDSLERYGRFDFGTECSIEIERWSLNRAIETYRSTLLGIKGSMEGEPISATMVTKATVKWRAEPTEIGYKVPQTHIGMVRPEMKPLVEAWVGVGKPYTTSGGFYYTKPNKSFQRVVDLSRYPEIRDAVRRLGLEDKLARLFEIYIPMRHEASSQMLEELIAGRDPEIFSRGNEEAGTGLEVRGMRLKRKDLVKVARDLKFLLPYQAAAAVAFAATQIAELPPEQVFVIRPYDHHIKGAIAARSDMDVHKVDYDGDRLTVEGTATTRQVGSDATGVLSSALSERQRMGASVTEKVIREYKHERCDYPFTSRLALLRAWDTDAKPFKGKPYIIGEDFGTVKPVKSGADGLFSRAFVLLGGTSRPKMLSDMISGRAFTGLAYAPLHYHYAEKIPPEDRLLVTGDDLNWITMTGEPSFFGPYEKVKSTDSHNNTKKILGAGTAFSTEEDPEGLRRAYFFTIPRAIKSLSSASKRGGQWGESLSRLAMAGTLELRLAPEVEEAVSRDIPIILPYQFWAGKRRDLLQALKDRWQNIQPDVRATLGRYNEDIEFRLAPEDFQEEAEDD